MTATSVQTKMAAGDIEMTWVRSNWPVKSSRGSVSAATTRLGEALTHGIQAQCDPKRAGFYEVIVEHTWFYFHVADRLGYVYIIACVSFLSGLANDCGVEG